MPFNGRFFSDGFITYLHTLCPDWVKAKHTADIPESYFQKLNEVKLTGKIISDDYTNWYEYSYHIYIQELFYTVVELNGWQLFTTSEQEGDPLAIVKNNEVIGLVMPGDRERIERVG